MRGYSFFLTLLLLLVITSAGAGQSPNFTDGFEDGNFTEDPAWTGDDSLFVITANGENNLLRLAGNEQTDAAYLSAPSEKETGYWEFYFKYNASAPPSSANKAIIFLMSDRADLKGPVNGYAVQTGRTGNDFFEIVRYENGLISEVILTDTTVISNNDTGYRVKVIRSASGGWQIAVGRGYAGKLFNSGRQRIDNTFTSSSYFGVLVNYTSSRTDNFFFDFSIELPPLSIEKVFPSGDHYITVVFNRPLNAATVSAEDFMIDSGPGEPASVEILNDTTVRLYYPRGIVSGSYTLSIGGIRAANGKRPGRLTRSFILFGLYSRGDVKLNEFLYDPPEGLDEYIELVNTSDKYLNLSGWQLGDGSALSTINTDPVSIAPHRFLVISADTVSLYRTFGERPYLHLNLPSLNNSGDAVRLLTPKGLPADSLSYTPAWGGEGRALERRSVQAGSIYRENWGVSPAETGTPGTANLIDADLQPPLFTGLLLPDASTLKLVFSETISTKTALILSNYTITPSRAIRTIETSKNTATLFLRDPLVPGETYTVAVSGITDIFGNKLSPSVQKAEYLKTDKAKKGDLVINEFLSDGETEFVEIYNPTDKNFNLGHWYLGDGSGRTSIGEKVLLKANSYLILSGSKNFSSAQKHALTLTGFPSLNNANDSIYLLNKEGQVIDSLHYSERWGGVTGISLERKDPLAASNDPSNWEASSHREGHTAGTKNSRYHPDEKPPRPVFSRLLQKDRVVIHFSEFIRLTEETEFSISGRSLAVVSFRPTRANIIKLAVPAAKKRNTGTTITISNLSDVKGNMVPKTKIPVARPLRASDVVINEILYAPLNDPDDNRPDQGEYIELRNTRSYAVSLEGMVLHDAPDEDGGIRIIRPVSTTAKWIKPHGVALIYADNVPIFNRSKIADFFDLEGISEQHILRADRSGLSLGTTGDAIFIADSSGHTIDSVFYDESWQNPNLADTRGIALERIFPPGKSNHSSNWGSSVHPAGGTPMAENSIFQENEAAENASGITFTPNPFSPDGDGYEDRLFINYKLDEAGYLLRVRIYDRYGRFITELADGRQAGFEGTLIWDGRRNNGSRNRIGIYIIVFEAYNSTTGRRRNFKKTVVLARKLH